MASEQAIFPEALPKEFYPAFELQKSTIKEFYRLASVIGGDVCPIAGPPEELMAFKRNFFSTLFLAVTARVSKDRSLLPLYAMVNQCMRAWVTACDNLLDDEYKEIFPFEFSAKGPRVRSVLTLLLADRVLVEFIAARYAGRDLLETIERESLAALVPSALQECEEESRPVPILPPEVVLNDIHKRKTADLFKAPLILPSKIEDIPQELLADTLESVGQFGLACQVLDDCRDMESDMAAGRHNFLVSLAHRSGSVTAPAGTEWYPWEVFPETFSEAIETAAGCFSKSFSALNRAGINISEDGRAGIAAYMCKLLRVPPEGFRLGER